MDAFAELHGGSCQELMARQGQNSAFPPGFPLLQSQGCGGEPGPPGLALSFGTQYCEVNVKLWSAKGLLSSSLLS